VTNHSSNRSMFSYFREVWNNVWSMWKPTLSAANAVRFTLIPPNARTATRPSGSRLHGHPQCSIWMTSPGARRTKNSTTSWSAKKSEPFTVSNPWESKES